MKRFWPLAFLLLLFGALVLRPAPGLLHPPRSVAPSPSKTIATDEAPVPAPAPAAPVAAQPEPDPVPPEERHEQAMKRSAVGASIHWLATHQNPDGSWGGEPVTVGGRTIGRTGITSLALLTLLGAGYSQLSRDEYDGEKTMGEVCKRALKWFLQDQREDGTFGAIHDPGFDQVLATLALSEAYGMTAAQPLKEPVERAVEAMVRMQGTDGSWGSAEVTAWAVQALFSAQLSEVPAPVESHQRALEYVETTPHPGNLLSRILLTRKKDGLAGDAELLARSLPPADAGDFGALFFATHGLFSYAGPDGETWKQYSPLMKDAILPFQQRNGSWQGGTDSHTVVRTSLAGLTLQVYYRYANIVSPAK